MSDLDTMHYRLLAGDSTTVVRAVKSIAINPNL